MLPGQGQDDLPHLPGPGGIGDVLDPILDPIPPVIGAIGDVLDPILGHVAPVIDAVGNLLHPILDQLPPVLGAVGNVVGTVENVVAPVLNTVDHVIAPVSGIVGDLTHALEPVLDQVTSPLTEIVGDTALQPIVGVITDLAGPVTSLLGLGSSSEANSASAPIALASGSLDLDHTLSPSSLLNDLFSGGRYTAYNLALQSHATDSGAVTAPALAGSGTLLSLVDHVVGSAGDGHDPQAEHGPSHAVSLPSILDDMALRGLGDGISG